MNRFKQLKQLPCVGCGNSPVDIAHANWATGCFKDGGKGMGIKADDEYTIPLCRSCHKWLDTYQGLDRDKAKAWFLNKWTFVNAVLQNKPKQNGVDF